MKICTPFTVLRSQFLSRESITSLLTAGARTRAACQSSAMIGQGTRIRDLWLVNHTFIATPRPVQCSVITANAQWRREREGDTWQLFVIPASGCGSTQITQNCQLFHWTVPVGSGFTHSPRKFYLPQRFYSSLRRRRNCGCEGQVLLCRGPQFLNSCSASLFGTLLTFLDLNASGIK